MKYIIGKNEVNGHHAIVVFGTEMVHRLAAVALMKSAPKVEVVSAGFVNFVDGNWVVSGEGSESLEIGPAAGDQLLLNLFLKQGLTGLDLSNMLAYLKFNPSLVTIFSGGA